MSENYALQLSGQRIDQKRIAHKQCRMITTRNTSGEKKTQNKRPFIKRTIVHKTHRQRNKSRLYVLSDTSLQPKVTSIVSSYQNVLRTPLRILSAFARRSNSSQTLLFYLRPRITKALDVKYNCWLPAVYLQPPTILLTYYDT